MSKQPDPQESQVTLGQFVQQTIKEVVEGIQATHEVVKESGANIGYESRDIEFDVAVSVTNLGAKERGAGLFVGPISVGGKGHSESTNSSETRVRFKVPVIWPTTVQISPGAYAGSYSGTNPRNILPPGLPRSY